MSINIAEQLEENEQYDKAYEEYKKIHSKKPKSIEVLERLGHLAMILHKNDDATEYYNKILEIDATNTLAYEQLMDVYFHTDRYKYYISRGNLHVLQKELSHAINDFKKALDKAQGEQETNTTRFALANLYEQVGKNHQAIDAYLRILDTSALNEAVFLNLANVYLKENSLTGAIETLERAIENGFSSDKVKENLAQLYLKNNQTKKARELSSDELVKVKSLLDEGENQSAYDILSAYSSKKTAQYYSLMAQYYYNIQNWEKSLENVIEFEKFEKNSPLVYQMRALIYEEQGKEFDAHLNWAKLSLAKNDQEVGLNEYYMAYQIKSDDAVLIREMAELLEELGDKNQACEFWEKLSQIDTSNRKALEKIADFKESIGDYRAQVEFLEKLYSIDLRSSLIIKKLAKAYEKLKNKEKALEFYNKFIQTSPVNDEYQQIKDKISKLENTQMEEDEGLLGKLIGFFSKR